MQLKTLLSADMSLLVFISGSFSVHLSTQQTVQQGFNNLSAASLLVS